MKHLETIAAATGSACRARAEISSVWRKTQAKSTKPRRLCNLRGFESVSFEGLDLIGRQASRLAEAAVHIGDFGGHAGCQIGQQEGGDIAHVFNGHVAAQG